MSCNGCKVLRRGCSQSCPLRPCLEWIDTPKSQGNATLFVSRFYGRSDLMSFVSSVSPSEKSALFQSLLYEACGRTVNPVSGAVGLLATGNWHVCQEAVKTVLAGEELLPAPGSGGFWSSESSGEASEYFRSGAWRGKYSKEFFMQGSDENDDGVDDWKTSPAEASELTASFWSGGSYDGGKEPKLLNLFV